MISPDPESGPTAEFRLGIVRGFLDRACKLLCDPSQTMPRSASLAHNHSQTENLPCEKGGAFQRSRDARAGGAEVYDKTKKGTQLGSRAH